MAADAIRFNGKEISWKGHGNWKATSGGKWTDAATGVDYDYQSAKYQDLTDRGPIPEGQYMLSAVDAGNAFDKKGRLDARAGIEQLAPEGSNIATLPGGAQADATEVIAAWGHNRVRLAILQINKIKARKRNGFYIHDSHKGQTHGCIEVEQGFFVQLREYAADQKKLGKRGKPNVRVIVEYPSASANTNGGTKF